MRFIIQILASFILSGCSTGWLVGDRGTRFERNDILSGRTIVVMDDRYDVIMGPNGKLLKFKASRDTGYGSVSILVNDNLDVMAIDLYNGDSYVDRGVIVNYGMIKVEKMKTVNIKIESLNNIPGENLSVLAKAFFSPFSYNIDGADMAAGSTIIAIPLINIAAFFLPSSIHVYNY